jgi:hypothetical protein
MWYTMTLPPFPVLIQPRLSTPHPGKPSCRLESSVTSRTTSIGSASPSIFPRSMTSGSPRKSIVITLNSPSATVPSLRGSILMICLSSHYPSLRGSGLPPKHQARLCESPSSQREFGCDNGGGGGSTSGDRDGAPPQSQPPLHRL